MEEIDALSAVTGITQERIREAMKGTKELEIITKMIRELAEKSVAENPITRVSMASTLIMMTVCFFEMNPNVLHLLADRYHPIMSDTINISELAERLMKDNE